MSTRRTHLVARLTVGVALAGAVITAATVQASATTVRHFTTPAPGTTITGNLKTGTKMLLKGSINGIPITVSCTKFTGIGKAPKTGLTITISPPTFGGCTDTLGGKDTVKPNQTNGKWKVTETIPVGNKDTVSLTIPMAGATFSSSLVPGCVITAAPSIAAKVTGPYDNVNTVTVTASPIKVSAAGCSATTATVTATVVFSPNVEGVS